MYLSVIMPVYNETLNQLNKSIRSILNQTFTDFEFIIIVDNPRAKYIKDILSYWESQDKRIKVIFNKNNLGLVKTENKGIRSSKGKYIVRVDADDVSDTNRIESQLTFLKKNNLDLTGCNCRLKDMAGNIVKKHLFSTISQCNQNKIKHVLTHCNIMSGSSLLYKRNVFKSLHGYRVKLIDDYDFVSRALIHGFRIGYQADDLLMKTFRSNSLSNSNSLIQFKSTVILGNYLKDTHFKQDPSLKFLQNSFNEVSHRDKNKYKYFLMYKEKYKINKSIIDLLMAICEMCSSKCVLYKYLWSKYIFNNQNRLIR